MIPVDPHRKLKLALICGLGLLAVAAAMLAPPFPQDSGYHAFADQRTLLGIPNFWNVFSNVAFLPVGIAGLWLLRARVPAGGVGAMRTAYQVFFAGVTLVAFGSGYYHLAPDNATLLWDRLPMAVGFMAFFAAMLGENISIRTGQRLLWPLVAVGLFSAGYWYYTELGGRGDLRLYALVQFLPMLLIPLMLILFRSPFTGNVWLWLAIAGYAAAKVAEYTDVPVFQLTGMGGHAIKHVLAALGALGFLVALQRRRPVGHD